MATSKCERHNSNKSTRTVEVRVFYFRSKLDKGCFFFVFFSNAIWFLIKLNHIHRILETTIRHQTLQLINFN